MQNNMQLKQAREEHGWSQKDVAEKIGTDPKTVSRWERRVAYPSPYFRQKLSALFEKSLSELDLFAPSEKEPAANNTLTTEPSAPLSANTEQSKQAENSSDSDTDSDESARQIDVPIAAIPASQQVRTTTLQLRNRTRMLGRLGHAYDALLDASLQKIARIELGLVGMPNAVQNAMNRLIRLSQQEEQILPPGTSILEVYEMAGHELLILGEPGAGKSTLLLDLAQLLVQRAKRDEEQPLPVVLRISSWAEEKLPLEDWMSQQLALTYDISQKLSAQWVHDGQVLPLLDGLDEMDVASRPACIAAINAYHREHLLVPLVICSRRTEYEDAAFQQKLMLQHAVLIQPLTLQQVMASFDQVGQPLEALRQTLQTNHALQELVTTPLMVSILMLTYAKMPMPALSQEIATLQKQMWSDYVTRMAEQKGDIQRYPLQQTHTWLSWLARNLQQHYQTVFYLEHVQSDWLPDSLQQPAFWLTMRLPLLLLGILVSCIIGLFLQTVFDLTTGIQAAVLGCTLASCFSQFAETETRTPASHQTKRSSNSNVARVLISIGTGLVCAGSFGFEMGPGYGQSDWIRDGLIYGSVIALACLLLLVLFPRLSSRHDAPHPLKGMAYIRYLFSALHLRRALAGGIVLGLAYGLSTGWSYGAGYGISTALNFMLSYGCVVFLISLIVEKNRGDIGLTERLRWSWSSFGRTLVSFRHCVISGALTLGTLLIVGLSYGITTSLGVPASTNLGFRLSYGLSDGLGSGLGTGPGAAFIYGLIMGLIVGIGTGFSYWLMIGLFQSIAQEQIEDQDRGSLNQGVRRSALNSAIIGLMSGGVIAGIGFLGYWLSYGLNEGLSQGMNAALNQGINEGLGDALGIVWFFAISGSIFGWAISGGWAVLRHVVLRWLLNRQHIFPWQAQAFLNDATARILLRRVGGGYSFIHRLLLEYFTALDEEN